MNGSDTDKNDKGLVLLGRRVFGGLSLALMIAGLIAMVLYKEVTDWGALAGFVTGVWMISLAFLLVIGCAALEVYHKVTSSQAQAGEHEAVQQEMRRAMEEARTERSKILTTLAELRDERAAIEKAIDTAAHAVSTELVAELGAQFADRLAVELDKVRRDLQRAQGERVDKMVQALEAAAAAKGHGGRVVRINGHH